MRDILLIFLPDTLRYEKNGFVRGFYKSLDSSQACYITSDIVSKTYSRDCIGHIGHHNSTTVNNSKNKPLVLINERGEIAVNPEKFVGHSIVQITYDFNSFKNSDIVESGTYGVHFRTLSQELRKNGFKNARNKKHLFPAVVMLLNSVMKVLRPLRQAVSYSATYLHFEEGVLSMKWAFGAILKNNISPKLGNTCLAKIIDMALGIVIMNYFLKHETYILDTIKDSIEDILSSLKGLLLYLMGSPIGLKLNYAFNKFLGQFFFYNISLWRIFLYALQPLFDSYFRYFVLLGTLGCSFQLAVFSDIISVSTFQVYCIYVYAARLFNLQLKGLISLWRLFIGRKYNPLRNRVDSCQYSQNQLFIGTLGFTVLLFLMPTTIMYYTVFSMFRLVIVLIDALLHWARYLLNVVPLYVFTLWITKSSSVAGSLNMKYDDCDEKVCKIKVKLDTLPLAQCIKKCLPEPPGRSHSLSYYFHCIATGTLV